MARAAMMRALKVGVAMVVSLPSLSSREDVRSFMR